MHEQSRNPQHERSHRLSLMPMDRTNAQGGSYVRQIRALADDRRDEGSLSLLAGLSLVAGCLAALIGFILFLGAM